MKIIILFTVFLSVKMFSQVGINTSTPNPSSILDINSTDKGILIPRVEITNLYDSISPILNPAHGLMVFNTLNLPGQEEGFYYWNGNQWTKVGSEKPISSISNKDIPTITIANTSNFNIINNNIIEDMKLEFTAHKSTVLLILSASGNSSNVTIGDIYILAIKTTQNGIQITPQILGGTACQIGGIYEEFSTTYSNNKWNCNLTIMVDNLTIGSTYTFEIAARTSIQYGNPLGIRILNSNPENHLTLSVVH